MLGHQILPEVIGREIVIARLEQRQAQRMRGGRILTLILILCPIYTLATIKRPKRMRKLVYEIVACVLPI